MARHVVVGAGAVGAQTATLLADAGHEVVVVTRSGGGPEDARVRRMAADAADPAALRPIAAGAAALYNCANPPYHRWPTDWPPLAASLLATAEATGAVLVTMGNLYGYGPVDHPMTERDPLAATSRKGRVRIAMWNDALAAHQAGRARVTEARASDFFGPGATGNAHLGDRFVPALLAGKRVWLVGDPDAPHSWTYLPDVARALVVLGTDERAWGRSWHVPTGAPLSQRAVAQRLSELAGAPAPRVGTLPRGLLRTAGLAVPLLRELDEVRYQLDRPFVVDSSDFTETFGLTSTPMDEALSETIAWWQDRSRAVA